MRTSNHPTKSQAGSNYEKYRYYELSVQSPGYHVEWFAEIYKELTGKRAESLREDFSGTFLFAVEWVKAHKENLALAVDLDPEPLAYGREKHWKKLKPDQRKRLTLLNSDVLIPTKLKNDLIIACNFSFCIFKQRQMMLDYLKSCLKSLNPNGLVILELAGGPGMIAGVKERRTVKIGQKKKFLYTWHQKSFDPISRNGHYAIHFKLPDGRQMQDAFTYDWRLWTIPELRDLFEEAGYSRSHVYWETSHKGKGTGEYLKTESGDNAHSWIAYVVGQR